MNDDLSHAAQASRKAGGGKIQRPTGLGESVYETILNRLMSLSIAPGARITVDALSRELGVSQTPIREALGRLEEQGLVVKIHHIGYSAAPQVGLRSFNELYELRLLLEPAAAARAAKNMTDPYAAKISALAARMEGPGSLDARKYYSRFARLDAEFHDLILQISGNELIRETIERLHVHMHLFRLHYNVKLTGTAVREHAAIVKALKQRDSKRAESAMRRHIELSRKRFIASFDELDRDTEGRYTSTVQAV